MKRDLIWFALLVALCLLIVQAVHGDSMRRSYIKRTQRHIDHVHAELIELADGSWWYSIYVVRAEMDLELVRLHLNAYRHGRVERVMVESAVRQLDRDMEDYPPTEREESNGKGR